MLEDDLDGASLLTGAPAGRIEPLSPEPNRPALDWDQPDDGPPNRRLSAPALADQCDHLTLTDLQHHVAYGLDPGRPAAVAARQVVDHEQRSDAGISPGTD